MKVTRLLLLLAVLLLLPWGLSSSAEAGCGSSSGCGMSHATQQQSAAPTAKAGQYTCPMHPEVVSDKPGKCHKCGMNLEKVQSTAEDQSEMTGDMAAQCQKMVDEFTSLEDHFDMMMKLTDVEDLGPAMVKHREMMAQFSVDLAKHQNDCRQKVSVKDNNSSAGSEHATHIH